MLMEIFGVWPLAELNIKAVFCAEIGISVLGKKKKEFLRERAQKLTSPSSMFMFLLCCAVPVLELCKDWKMTTASG
jgi:hypothetical protein